MPKLAELYYTIDKCFMLDVKSGNVVAVFVVRRRGNEIAKVFESYTDAEFWIDQTVSLQSAVTRGPRETGAPS